MDIPEIIKGLRTLSSGAWNAKISEVEELAAHAANNLESLYNYVGASRGRLPGLVVVRRRTLFLFSATIGSISALLGALLSGAW